MTCLRCLRCQANCPSGVRVDMLMNFAREKMACELGMPLLGRLSFRHLLPRRWLFNLLVRLSAFSQKILPRTKSTPHLRNMPLFFHGKRRIPTLSARSALKTLPEVSLAIGEEKARVAFFIGCLTNYSYTRIACALVELLNRCGVTVVVPKKQLCCGQPVIGYGDVKAARRLAQHNVEVFNGVECDAIVTGCASCGRMLKHEYESLLEDAASFRAPVRDICEYLVNEAHPQLQRSTEKITWHDPCHLIWGQGINAEPRELLRAAGDFEEMPDAARCCGGGGSFSLFHYDLSSAIASHKVRAISECTAQTVLTDCPGCILQIQDRLAAEGVERRVRHLVEFLLEQMPKKEL